MTSIHRLQQYGFKFGQNGAHSARSMMLRELEKLFAATSTDTTKEQYQNAICDLNVLDKPTAKARALTFRHLADLYGMSNEIAIFRSFRKLWPIDPSAQAVLALQFALVRDPLLRMSISRILDCEVGDLISRESIEDLLRMPNPDRFSLASLKSFAQNINGTWTQAGYLTGKNKKVRSSPNVTPVNVAFSLFLAYLEGASGERLLKHKWSKLLGLNDHQLKELTIAASHRGIIDFKQSGGVTDIRFPGFITKEEESWLYE